MVSHWGTISVIASTLARRDRSDNLPPPETNIDFRANGREVSERPTSVPLGQKLKANIGPAGAEVKIVPQWGIIFSELCTPVRNMQLQGKYDSSGDKIMMYKKHIIIVVVSRCIRYGFTLSPVETKLKTPRKSDFISRPKRETPRKDEPCEAFAALSLRPKMGRS